MQLLKHLQASQNAFTALQIIIISKKLSQGSLIVSF